jgi:hypothetical protein
MTSVALTEMANERHSLPIPWEEWKRVGLPSPVSKRLGRLVAYGAVVVGPV